MTSWLAPAHLVLTLVIIIWDVILAGRIAQLRQASRPFAAITGLAGLLLIPAVIVAVATTTLITGRAITAVDWIWPVTTLLFATQAVYAVARRLVNPLWGYPIAFYNVMLLIAAGAKYFVAHGFAVPRPFLVVMAAEVDALALLTTEAAIMSPFFLHVPFISPAFPALSSLTGTFRMTMASLALLWFGVILAEVPRADVALNSYRAHAEDRITERPGGFSIGLKMFPDLESPPSAASVRSDLEVAAYLGVNVVHIVFVPGASTLAIDSVAKALDTMRRDSLTVIASLGYGGKTLPQITRAPLDTELRLATLRRIVARLRPDIIMPAQDPYGIGARIHGRLDVSDWQGYFTRAAAIVQEMRPRTLVGYSASSYDARDSTMYAWAAARGSPIETLGFSFYPTRLGARAMDAGFRAADRWMAAHPPTKPHWVFSAGGYPLAHGEYSQDRAIWAALAWATSHPEVRGAVVTEANDYGQTMGLRAPDGRYRLASVSTRRALLGIRETFGSPEPARPATVTR